MGGVSRHSSHPARFQPPSEDHVKALVPSNTLLGHSPPPTTVVPLYFTPFTISSSRYLSVLKAIALRSKPTAELSGVIVHDWLLP